MSWINADDTLPVMRGAPVLVVPCKREVYPKPHISLMYPVTVACYMGPGWHDRQNWVEGLKENTCEYCESERIEVAYWMPLPDAPTVSHTLPPTTTPTN